MSSGDIETYRRNGRWRNRIQGQAGDLPGEFDSRVRAAHEGLRIAVYRSRYVDGRGRVEHIVRNDAGDIETRTSYPRAAVGSATWPGRRPGFT